MEQQQRLDELRRRMVQEQLVSRGIYDPRVLEAFRRVARHAFVGDADPEQAYGDHPLPIGQNQTISQPYIVALMTEALRLKETDRVLDVGTGSGYQAAILAELVQAVYAVERLPSLMQQARRVLEELGYTNIYYRIGDGTAGWPEESPFDAILVAAATKTVPEKPTEQLAPGGRLILPVGNSWFQDLVLITREESGLHREKLCGVRFVPLIQEKEKKERQD